MITSRKDSLIAVFATILLVGHCQASSSGLRGNKNVLRFDARQKFTAKDFMFDLKGAEPEIEGVGGTVKVADLGGLPVLAGEGVSYGLVELEACGLNLPHHHPRAAELGYIIKSETATSVRHAFVEENGGRLIMNDIGKGQVALVPAGLVHFLQNMGCSPATFLAAFSSEDPGVVTTTIQGLGLLPEGTIQATLALGSDDAKALVANLPTGVVEGEMECLKRCGIAY